MLTGLRSEGQNSAVEPYGHRQGEKVVLNSHFCEDVDFHAICAIACAKRREASRRCHL